MAAVAGAGIKAGAIVVARWLWANKVQVALIAADTYEGYELARATWDGMRKNRHPERREEESHATITGSAAKARPR